MGLPLQSTNGIHLVQTVFGNGIVAIPDWSRQRVREKNMEHPELF